MNRKKKVRKLLRYNPDTGLDANDFAGFTDSQKSEAKQMLDNGAVFYWDAEKQPDGYHRVELSNFKFAFEMVGYKVVTDDTKPSLTLQ